MSFLKNSTTENVKKIDLAIENVNVVESSETTAKENVNTIALAIDNIIEFVTSEAPTREHANKTFENPAFLLTPVHNMIIFFPSPEKKNIMFLNTFFSSIHLYISMN